MMGLYIATLLLGGVCGSLLTIIAIKSAHFYAKFMEDDELMAKIKAYNKMLSQMNINDERADAYIKKYNTLCREADKRQLFEKGE